MEALASQAENVTSDQQPDNPLGVAERSVTTYRTTSALGGQASQ